MIGESHTKTPKSSSLRYAGDTGHGRFAQRDIRPLNTRPTTSLVPSGSAWELIFYPPHRRHPDELQLKRLGHPLRADRIAMHLSGMIQLSPRAPFSLWTRQHLGPAFAFRRREPHRDGRPSSPWTARGRSMDQSPTVQSATEDPSRLATRFHRRDQASNSDDHLRCVDATQLPELRRLASLA